MTSRPVRGSRAACRGRTGRRRAAADRPTEIGFIAAIIVMIPQMQAQPGAAGRPETPSRAVDGRGRAPQVGVVVDDPAARAVHLPRGPRAGLGEVPHHRDQRGHAFLEPGRLGRPVVHLRVDVDRVLAAPGRVGAVVPQALQIGGLAARPRRCDQQIAAILKVERGERGVVRGLAGADALVGRTARRGRAAEVDRRRGGTGGGAPRRYARRSRRSCAGAPALICSRVAAAGSPLTSSKRR